MCISHHREKLGTRDHELRYSCLCCRRVKPEEMNPTLEDLLIISCRGYLYIRFTCHLKFNSGEQGILWHVDILVEDVDLTEALDTTVV